MRSSFQILAIAFLAWSVVISQATARIRVVAASGQPVPGSATDEEFYNFKANAPTINNSGEVAFVAEVVSSTSPVGVVTGVWTTAGDDLTPVITDSEPAPGIPNDRRLTLWFNHVAINDSGAIAFDDRFEWWHSDVKLGTEGGIWSNQDGDLRLVARMGDPAPGAPTGSVLDALPMALRFNNRGDIAFLAQYDDGLDNDRDPSRHGIWMHGDGELVPIAVTGQPSPGIVDGSFQWIHAPLLTDAGYLTFAGIARANGKSHQGLWSNRSGALDAVLLEGDLLPISDLHSAPSVGTARFAVNGKDQVAFSTMVKLADDQTQSGLWLERDGGLALVMHQGQQAPGTPAGSVFRYGPGEFSLNDAGQIAVTAQYTTDKLRFEPRVGAYVPVYDTGVWLYDDEQLKLIARQGDLAPNFPSETRFTQFSPPMLNASGQVAFQAFLQTVDEQGASQWLESIWATDLNGKLNLVAYTGMQIDIDNGDSFELREILDLDFGHKLETVGTSSPVFTGTADGRGRSFNDRGELAFHVRISDDSGGIASAVLVADTLAIPEPTGLLIAGGLFLAVWGVRIGEHR